MGMEEPGHPLPPGHLLGPLSSMRDTTARVNQLSFPAPQAVTHFFHHQDDVLLRLCPWVNSFSKPKSWLVLDRLMCPEWGFSFSLLREDFAKELLNLCSAKCKDEDSTGGNTAVEWLRTRLGNAISARLKSSLCLFPSPVSLAMILTSLRLSFFIC